jgi:hypothetical protein
MKNRVHLEQILFYEVNNNGDKIGLLAIIIDILFLVFILSNFPRYQPDGEGIHTKDHHPQV